MITNIALGTLVAFDEVAYIVRKKKGWFIPQKGNFEVPMIEVDEDTISLPLTDVPGRWLHTITSGTNKGIIAFPSSGSCFIVGMETKMFGHSIGPSGGGGGFGEDWEPGYFEARGKIDLYVGRSELRGKSFYIPIDKVTVLKAQAA